MDVLNREQAVQELSNGGVVAFYTETLVGLAADPRNDTAVQSILELKGRESEQGIPCIIDEPSRLAEWIAEESPRQLDARLRLQERFWPGPLTLVIAPSAATLQSVSSLVLGPGSSLAMRVSPVPPIAALARGVGGAVTATSCNPHGAPPAKTFEEASAFFPDVPFFDSSEGGSVEVGNWTAPSTILDVREQPFVLLREGAIDSDALREFL